MDHPQVCAVCAGTQNVSEVTDGRVRHPLCEECRELVLMLLLTHDAIALEDLPEPEDLASPDAESIG